MINSTVRAVINRRYPCPVPCLGCEWNKVPCATIVPQPAAGEIGLTRLCVTAATAANDQPAARGSTTGIFAPAVAGANDRLPVGAMKLSAVRLQLGIGNAVPGGAARSGGEPSKQVWWAYGIGRIALVLGAHHILTPSVQVRFLYDSFGSCTETGSTANLMVSSPTLQTLEERGELKLTRITLLNSASTLLIHLTGGALGVGVAF
jgi:hypothetical protein